MSTATRADPARQMLQEAIAEAVRKEDFESAANLKLELERINAEDPIFSLNQQIDAAVEEEDYVKASQLKAQLEEVKEKLRQEEEDAAPKTTCETVTRGVKVTIRSFYKAIESRQMSGKLSYKIPRTQAGKYFFNYHVHILNQSEVAVQLRRRHWEIVDKDGYTQDVWGPGVVGKQPVLQPGQSFQYSSYCPLATPTGLMTGEYEMVVLDAEENETDDVFEAVVGPLKLSATN